MSVSALPVEGGSIVLARVLFVTDLHKRYSDTSSIKNVLKQRLAIQNDIIAAVKVHNITHIIIGGDWYDRGFHGLGQAYGAIEMDRRISATVNGNVYLCVGNHLYLERDENPELYICQPNELVKPQIDIPIPEQPVFRLVPKLRIGNVQISFFHFSKINKQYVMAVEEGVTTHVGVYHDDAVVPGYIAEMDGFTTHSTNSYMNDIYRNVDIALHGHIHSKVGVVSYELNSGRKVPLIIPGALGITQNKDCFKHTSVQLPVLEIADDSSVALRALDMSTHLDMLKFYATAKKQKEVITEVKDTKFVQSKLPVASLPAFMTAKGYNFKHLKMIDAASKNILSLGTAASIVQEVETL